MEKQVYKFTNEIDELEINSLAAKIKISPHSEDFVLAEYDNQADNPKLCAVLKDKKLTFKEDSTFTGLFRKPDEEYSLSVFVPRKVFTKIEIGTASGGADIKEIGANVFELATASGDVNAVGSFEEIKVKTASGNVNFTNSAEQPAKSVKISTASGNVEVSAPSEKFSISCVSGKTSLKNACGEGKVSLTSGSVDVDYKEWNGALSINAVSGKVNVTVPDDSGAELSFSCASGTLRTDLGGEKGKLMNIGKGTDGTLGTGNIQKLDVRLTSGTVTVMRS